MNKNLIVYLKKNKTKVKYYYIDKQNKLAIDTAEAKDFERNEFFGADQGFLRPYGFSSKTRSFDRRKKSC